MAEGLALVDKTEEHSHEAELYRLKGELSLKSRPVRSHQPPTPKRRRKPKRIFTRLSRLLGGRKPSRGSYARQRAWRGCGSSRASEPKPGRYWRRSTVGSLKGLIRRTRKRRRRCWRNSQLEQTSLEHHWGWHGGRDYWLTFQAV